MPRERGEPKEEKDPLLLSARWQLSQDRNGDLEAAYGVSTHATWIKDPHSVDTCLVDYEPLKLSSFRVCCVRKGTIVTDSLLLIEQLLLVLLFLSCALPVYHWFRADISDDDVSMRRFIRQQESKMRQFATIMTGLCAFLLTFYTANVVGRWWTMRTVGVGGIKAAVVELEVLLYQCVTQDREILSAVRRYGRASMMLIFLWRRNELEDLDALKAIMVKADLLTDSECDQLVKWNKHCLHETIWAWQAAIVNNLKIEGKIPADSLYGLLLQKVLDGRAAVQCVHTHLAVRVPMQYVHLLGVLVKMHNVILAIILGILFAASLRTGKWILCLQLVARLFILPLLYNAILLINCDLADPFRGGEADFPGAIYQANLEKDCVGMMGATDHVPDFLARGDRSLAYLLDNSLKGMDPKKGDKEKPLSPFASAR